MPFGEYWPFKSFLLWLGLQGVVGEDYSEGNQLKPLQSPRFSAGVLICLESMYPCYYRELVKNGADMLVNIANNAWFHDSKAAELLFQMSRVRAVENNRYFVQCANTGISGMIHPLGHVIVKSHLNRREILSKQVVIGLPDSPFVKWGDWLVVASLAVVIGILFL